MKRTVIATLSFLAAAILAIGSPARAGEILPLRLDIVNWQTVVGPIPCIRFHARFSNPDALNTSGPVSGEMHTQPFGAFVPNGQLIGTFDVPPMQPSSFFDVFIDVPLTDLPPSAERILPGTGAGGLEPAAACPPDNFWAGNVNVNWSGAGGTGQANVHNGTLQICPGAAPSYIHVVTDCQDPAGITWSFGSLCPGWSAALVLNSNFAPGDPAPNPIPPGFFDGWICISADASVTVGANCNVVLSLNCGNQPATISLLAEACDWQATPVRPSTWGEVKTLLGR